jgi:hypothetical protein
VLGRSAAHVLAQKGEALLLLLLFCGGRSGAESWGDRGRPPIPPAAGEVRAQRLVASVASNPAGRAELKRQAVAERKRSAVRSPKTRRCRLPARVAAAALPESPPPPSTSLKRSAVRSPKNDLPPPPSCLASRPRSIARPCGAQKTSCRRHPRPRPSARPRGARKWGWLRAVPSCFVCAKKNRLALPVI